MRLPLPCRPGRSGLLRPPTPLPSPDRRRRADRLSEPNAGQWPAGLLDSRYGQLQRVGPGLVRCRLQGRSARTIGLRPSVRAHDVQGDAKSGPRTVRPADRGCRRLQQCLDERRLHQLLRGRSGQPPPAPALGRGRADELAGDRAGLLRLRARRGEGGIAQPRPRRSPMVASSTSICRKSPTTCIPMRGPASAASRISTPRRSRTSAPSTPPIIGPTMPCWSSPAISTRPSSTAGSTSISRRSPADDRHSARHRARAGTHRRAHPYRL